MPQVKANISFEKDSAGKVWLLQRPKRANVIIGARNESQLRQNLAAAEWNLTMEQVAKLDAASERRASILTGINFSSSSATRCRLLSNQYPLASSALSRLFFSRSRRSESVD